MLATGALVSGNPVASVIGAAASSSILVLATALVFALHRPRFRHLVGVLAAGFVVRAKRISGHRHDASSDSLDRALGPTLAVRMTRGRWIGAFAFSLLNWSAGAACLVTAILSTGARLPWNKVLLIYSAGATVSSFNLTPGGLGVVEGTLTTGLVGRAWRRRLHLPR